MNIQHSPKSPCLRCTLHSKLRILACSLRTSQLSVPRRCCQKRSPRREEDTRPSSVENSTYLHKEHQETTVDVGFLSNNNNKKRCVFYFILLVSVYVLIIDMIRIIISADFVHIFTDKGTKEAAVTHTAVTTCPLLCPDHTPVSTPTLQNTKSEFTDQF